MELKISLENFSEGYHQPWVHPDTADHEFPATMVEYADVSGPYGLFHLRQKNLLVPTFFTPGEGLPEPLLSTVTVFNVYRYLHALIDASIPLWLDFNIKNEVEHELIWNVLLPKGTLKSETLEAELAKFRAFIEPILGEDLGVCTGVGEAVHSRFITPGRYSHMEKTVHQFHNWWLDQMLPKASR